MAIVSPACKESVMSPDQRCSSQRGFILIDMLGDREATLKLMTCPEHEPPNPMIKAHPSVKVMMVNEGNHSKPLDQPEDPQVARRTGRNNTREVTDMAGWKETGALAGVYEWWIPNIVGKGKNRPWRVAPWYLGNWKLPRPHLVYTPAVVAKATVLIEKAACRCLPSSPTARRERSKTVKNSI